MRCRIVAEGSPLFVNGKIAGGIGVGGGTEEQDQEIAGHFVYEGSTTTSFSKSFFHLFLKNHLTDRSEFLF